MRVLITGGAGFIGTNAADYFARRGAGVVLVDNLSRRGSEANLRYLKREFGDRVSFVRGDVGDARFMESAVAPVLVDTQLVLHLAGQVAVTTSVVDPRADFVSNALGTFNMLEALRRTQAAHGCAPSLIYASTNKVYGAMQDIDVVENEHSYAYSNRRHGIGEDQPLDFHSPYGCSKGCGDQYVRDYSRIYGLDTVVMRQSCIYGERQMGVEDQGWVAWFAIASLLMRPVTLFGDGKQVRDVLWVGDLVRSYELAFENIAVTSGQVYNIGGGAGNTLSLRQLIQMLDELSMHRLDVTQSDWRPGDQKVCILDCRKAQRDFGWQPTVSPPAGVVRLLDWVTGNRRELESVGL